MEINILTGNSVLHDRVQRRYLVISDSMARELKNEVNFRKETPLIIATQNRAISAFKTLLGLKPDLDCQDINGNTALHIAVHMQKGMFARPLLALQANPNLLNNEGKSPLHLAIQCGNHGLVRTLIETGRDLDVDLVDGDGLTPLILATKYQQLKVFQELTKYRADLDGTDPRGNTALHWATGLSNCKMLHSSLTLRLMNQENNDGLTPLALAVKNGLGQSVEALLSRRADVSTVDRQGNTIIHLACEPEETHVLQHLLEKVIFRSVPNNAEGQTPLHRACELRNKNAVELLIKHQAMVNRIDSNGRTPLWTAVKAGCLETVQFLLGCHFGDDTELDVNRADINGDTPLHICSVYDNAEIARLLLEKGANKFLCNMAGQTPETIIPEETRHGSRVYSQFYSVPSPLGDISVFLADYAVTHPESNISFLE